jgi:transcriptional regulator with XRE-family HTH domain
MTIGQKIKSLRLASLTTQRELAHVLCIGEAYLSKIENDQKPLRREDLKLLSEYFQTPKRQLEILWLATKVYSILKDEKTALTVIKVAEEQLTYGNEKK